MKNLNKKELSDINEVINDTNDIFSIIDELDNINIDNIDIEQYKKKLNNIEEEISIKYQKYKKKKDIKNNLDTKK
jgi:hypothetical protein